MKKAFILIILSFLFFPSNAQTLGGEACALAKKSAFNSNKQKARVAFPGDQKIDVKYHKLNLAIDHNLKYIKGSVFTTFMAKESISKAIFDLSSALKVDSVKSSGLKLGFTKSGEQISVSLNKTLNPNESLSLEIFYQGTPKSSAFGSFSVATHGTSKSPVVWSLSEPYGAPDWWPCKDDPSDKIDSVDVWITMNQSFVSVSNGILKAVEANPNDTKTYKWKNVNPISHYLISIACSNYTLYQNTFTYNGKTMPVSHYIYPELLTNNLKSQLDQTVDMLKFFSDTFGEYPFMNEKYGHAMCNFGGGMEHQTVSSMGGFNVDLISHELAHQWFGDKITCKTWADIFMNEAFASYSEALYQEYKNGYPKYWVAISDHLTRAKKVTEPIFISNPANENLIFDFALTYGKGAVVLHMLRGVLGKETFFKLLKDFQNSEFAYKAASIDDFRVFAEKNTGKDLKYFFDEWIYGVSYPKYQFGWRQTSANSVSIDISQTKLNTNPSFFKMPIEYKLTFESGKEQMVTIFNEEISKTYEINNLPEKVTSILFDPNDLIMKELTIKSTVTSLEPAINESKLYPNPSQDYFEINLIAEKVEIYNESGQNVKSIEHPTKKINIQDIQSGVYVVKIYSKGGVISKKIIKN